MSTKKKKILPKDLNGIFVYHEEKRTVYVVIYTDQNNRRVKHLYYQDTEPKGGVCYHRARINVENGKIIRRKKEEI